MIPLEDRILKARIGGYCGPGHEGILFDGVGVFGG
jgi:hypothetical protein